VVRILSHLIVPLVGWSLSVSMGRSLHVPLDWWGVVACIAGVHAAYRFDDLVDAKGFGAMFDDLRDSRLLLIALDGLALGCAAFASPRLVAPLLVLSAVGVLYAPLKQVVPKNLLTGAAWTGTIFGLSLHGLEPTLAAGLAAAALFSLVVSNANLCDLPDIASDRENRVRGFTTILGARAAGGVAGGLGLVGAALALSAGVGALCPPGLFYAVLGFGFVDRLRERRAMRRWVDAALIVPGPLSLLLQ
jgi:hypothetical protein